MDIQWDSLPAPVRQTTNFFTEPVHFFRTYNRAFLREDLLAALTLTVVALPQGIAFALIAGLPPAMGLYATVIGSIVGALWGSSAQGTTGPTSALSLLVVSSLAAYAQPESAAFIVAAGLMAVMAGILQILMGVARLGILVNFVSDAVIVGFAAGAGVQIAAGELRHLFGLSSGGTTVVERVGHVLANLQLTNPYTLAVGVGTVVLLLLLKRYAPKLPAPLIALVVATLALLLFNLPQHGVDVLGQLPSSLPPFTALPLFSLGLLNDLSTGALAVTAIGLIQTMAVARAFAAQTGERLDSNQEFVGQGLANIAAGFFSGYPVSGSFSRSAVNFEAGARSKMSALLSGIFVLVAMLVLGPVGQYLPRAALAGLLLIVAYGMIDYKQMARILRGARGDALIMFLTFFGTIFLSIQFAVLSGILVSLAYYILKTSTPKVHEVLPDDEFEHLVPGQDKSSCPQLGIIEVLGDLYFGAVSHVEDTIRSYADRHPSQLYLMLRMRDVHHIDISGIHMLEGLLRSYRERGGDIFMTHLRPDVLARMKQTGFYDRIGADNILDEDNAIRYIFQRIMDPTICIYECNVRVWKECQNLPRPDYHVDLIDIQMVPEVSFETISPRALWDRLHEPLPPIILDVREAREWKRGHIPQARHRPLSGLLGRKGGWDDLPTYRPIILVDRSGRRSQRLAALMQPEGYKNLTILAGGMQAWENEHLLEAVESDYVE